MEGGGDSILDSIFDEKFEDIEDAEMLDVEDGELSEQNMGAKVGQNSDGDINLTSKEPQSKSCRRKNKKRQRRKKGSNSGPNMTDINRFVLDVCRRLKERKSFLACGGQKTADGKRYRTGGGILWGILKARDPNAYKEIMKKGSEFEKQLKRKPIVPTEHTIHRLNDLQLESDVQNQPDQASVEQNRPSVHDRIRVPVSYDDLAGFEDPKDAST